MTKTFIYADLSNFTTFTRLASTSQVIFELLSNLFSAFDNLTLSESSHLMKLRTIGDCYVLMSSLSISSTLSIAFKMLDILQQVKTSVKIKYLEEQENLLEDLNLRVGIHTG
jgi:class 3 adenylate cyclase